MLSVYTVPFRSGRVDLLKMLLLAWWDSALASWTYWVGLGRFVIVVMGWLITLAQLALRLVVDTIRQVIMFPFTMTGMMTQSYFQPGVPWVAFFLLVFWCLLESTVFTYTLMPTITEVLGGITGTDVSPYALPGLFIFLFFLISGPRHSPMMMRSGRIRSELITRSRIVTAPLPSTLTGRVSSGTKWF